MTLKSVRSPFKNDCLENKIALVTGGGSGICFEIGRTLLLHGCSGITIIGRREKLLQDAARALSLDTGKVVHYFVCDVRDAEKCKDSVQYSLKMFGRLDILVNGAAGNFLAEAGYHLKPKGFKTVVDIDAIGTYNMSFWAHSALKCSPCGGCIINISATLHYGATWWQTHASAAKAAVDSITRSLALEWGEYDIRVNGIAPGPIANTPGTMKLSPSLDSNYRDNLGIPLKRLGSTNDIALAVVFLASEGASFITGHTLVVDGGHHMYKSPVLDRDLVASFSSGVESQSRMQRPDLVSKL